MADVPKPNEPSRSRQAGRRPYSRVDHRARAHEEAHAEGPDGSPAASESSGAHPLVPTGPAELIVIDGQLHDLLGHLREAGSFAYDSEFIGELTYHPKLCLIQVASARKVALIDPLARIDLRPFWELLCEPSVEKVLHAGQQDIEPVVRHLGRGPVNLFDTQIAAGLAGLPYPVSLSKLVNELAGAKLGKGLTFTHWDQRPLSGMQLRYAADDVRYLPRVRAELGQRLEKLGHVEWARMECAAQCDPSLYGFNPDAQYLRVRGAGSLQPRNLAVLRELTIWRDGAARKHDVPPRSFLRDELLIDLARSPVKKVEQLAKVRGLPRPIEAADGPAIVEATARGLELATPNLPAARDFEPLPGEKFRSDALCNLAQCLCAARGIDPALVGCRQDFSEFYHLLQTGASSDSLQSSKIFNGWRKEAVGQPLLDAVNGKQSFSFKWDENSLRFG
jgi:ribonuclease D